jgi:hypothetical protein
MKKVSMALFACAFSLCAADFWASKPYTEWSDKEVQKMANNSPWSHPFDIPMSGPTPTGGTAAGNSGVDPGNAPPISEGGGGGRGGGRGGGGGGGGAAAPGGGDGGGGRSVTLVARWQSAMPIKQAFVRMKFGAEAATSADAKKLLETEEPAYVLVLSGNLRPFLRGKPEGLKQTIQDVTSLSVKGKSPLKLEDLQVSPSQIVFLFAKSAPISLDDKEVEFSTKLADVVLKYKFKLKDMVYNGKLEL